jgi:hypothetical protein
MSGKKDRDINFGKLPPLHHFILNPHTDLRCSTCPECNRKTLLRKVPLVVAIQPDQMIVINKHCRYCPDCDILIAHQDEIERMLTIAFKKRAPEIIGNDYLVIGTLEPIVWRKRGEQGVLVAILPESVHDFKGYLILEYIPPHWGPTDKEHPQMSKREADRRREIGDIPSPKSGRKRYRRES